MMDDFIVRYSNIDNSIHINLVYASVYCYALEFYYDDKYMYTDYFPNKTVNEVKSIASKFILNNSIKKVNHDD